MKIRINLNQIFTLIAFCIVVLFSSCSTPEEVVNDDTINRDRFLGSYEMSENCGGSVDDYTVTVSKGSGDNGLTLRNIYNTGVSAAARVSGDNLTIESQDFQIVDGTAVSFLEGNGFLSNEDNTLSINFSIYDSVTYTYCNSSGDK